MNKLFLILSISVISVFLTKNTTAQACFDSTFNSSISANTVYNIYANNYNEIFAAYSTGFVYSYLGTETTLLSGTTCYDICNADSIYIATINGLKTFVNNTIYNSTNLLSNPFKCVEADKYNNIWAGGDNGLLLKTSITGWQDISSQITGGVKDIFTDTSYNSKTYICTESNIYIFDNTSLLETYSINDIDANINNFNCIAIDDNGNIWIGTDNMGIYKKSISGIITNYRVQDGYLYSNQINNIKFDKYGNLWASTFIGLTYYDGTKWFTFTTTDGLTATDIKNTFIADNGYIWVACDDHIIPIMTGGTLNVNVLDNNSYPVGENQVLVELYYDHPLPGTGYNKFAEVKTDINGTAYFTGLLNYDYYIKTTILDTINLLNNGLVNTYYGGALSYDSAQTININCNSQNINLTLLTLPIQTGTGHISGTVKYHTYSKAAGEPVPGAEIIIEQEPNDDPVAMSVVNNQGYYNVNNLDTGYYTVELEFPGLPKISSYHNIHVANTKNSLQNLNFLVDTTVATGGAYADSITYAPVNLSNNIILNIYPNPTNDIINVDIKNFNNSNINLELFNLQGQKITEQQLNNKTNKIYLNNLKINKGIYFIKVYNKNNIFIKKIIYN